jgi:hypothetical protein
MKLQPRNFYFQNRYKHNHQTTQQHMGLFRSNDDDEVDLNNYGSSSGGAGESRFKNYLPSSLNITRVAFSSFLTFGFLLALFLRDDLGLAEKPFAKQVCNKYMNTFKASCAGKYQVYRVSFALSCFYLLFAFLSSRLFPVGDRVCVLLLLIDVTIQLIIMI